MFGIPHSGPVLCGYINPTDDAEETCKKSFLLSVISPLAVFQNQDPKTTPYSLSADSISAIIKMLRQRLTYLIYMRT